MEVSNSGYYVYARPLAEQMNKVNSFGKQLKDQEEVKEHILLNQNLVINILMMKEMYYPKMII